MPRQPKPWLRKSSGTWFVQIQGKQIPLGPNRADAFEHFYKLMGSRQPISPATTAADIIRRFLDWCGLHRPKSLSWYKGYLDSPKHGFLQSIGTVKISDLKPYHVTAWLDANEWGQTSRSCAIRAVKRPFQWAVDEGLLDVSPLKRVKRVKAKRREVIITPDQWAVILEATKDEAFRQFLEFMRGGTGCRPQEARIVEARHLVGAALVLAPEEAKGGRERTIVLDDKVAALVAKLMAQNPTGKLLRNTKGRPWSSSAVVSRFRRLRKRTGIEGLVAYTSRHTYATELLLNGVDPISGSILLGHADTKILSETYQKLQQKPDFLRQMANRARGAWPQAGSDQRTESGFGPPSCRSA